MRDDTGLVYVDVTIRNPADRTRSWVGPFLVGTGAVDSLVPRPRLESIGLEPMGQRMYETADGRTITMDVATGELEVMGEIAGGLILFGDADVEPRLGATVLASAGIEVDPQSQQLKKLPSVRLKRADAAAAGARRRAQEVSGTPGSSGWHE